MQIMVNGSNKAKVGTIEECIIPIFYGMRLIKGYEYYNLLDILWENRDGLFLTEKDTKRIDHKNLTNK